MWSLVVTEINSLRKSKFYFDSQLGISTLIDWPFCLGLDEAAAPHGRGTQQSKITDLFKPEIQKRKRSELGVSRFPLRTRRQCCWEVVYPVGSEAAFYDLPATPAAGDQDISVWDFRDIPDSNYSKFGHQLWMSTQQSHVAGQHVEEMSLRPLWK